MELNASLYQAVNAFLHNRRAFIQGQDMPI